MHRFLTRISPTSPFISKPSILKPFTCPSLPKRFFSAANSTDSNKDSAAEEASNALVQGAETQVAKAHPFFIDKSGVVTFVVDYPLFPMAKYTVNLDEAKFKMLSAAPPRYVAAVVRKNFNLPEENQDKDNNEPYQPKDVSSDFYNMGSYCSIEFNSRAFNMLTLSSLYRVEFSEIHRYKIPDYDPKQAHKSPLQQKVVTQHDDHFFLDEEHEDPDNPQVGGGANLEDLATKREKRLKFLLDKTRRTMQDENPLQVIEQGSFLISKLKPVTEPDFMMDINLEARLKHLIDIYTKILTLNRNQVPLVNYNLNDAYRILDSLGGFLAASRYFKGEELQHAYEQLDITSRLDGMHSLLRRYYSFLEHFADLGQIAQQNISARKAKEFYDEVFRIVKGAVEGDKGKQSVMDKLRAQFVEKKPPAHVVKVFEDEMKRFSSLEEMSVESNMIRTYLEWIVSLPYGAKSAENFDLNEAKALLDEDHYGLEDVKDRILEFIAVGKMKGTLKGKILCLVGPPGVGKTSLAGSIAKSLKRKFSRIALGGESDASTLKGHRRTYIGAYPGKIIQALKECGTDNCVILLDEIDKLGRSSFHGDPQSNLLEILDPAQNNTFTDNYLDFPVDLSNVLFICSANITDTIYEPLLDRVDLIQLSSYTNQEKKHIFYKHLYPKALEASGLKGEESKFVIKEEVVDILVNEYCRESGVRSLEKHVRKILEKLALQVVENPDSKEIVVNKDNLSKFVGNPKFGKGRFYRETPPGVICGLAYTEYGGSLIYIEATQSSFPQEDPSTPRGALKITGSLGSVMKESMQIAYTYAKSYLHSQLKNDFLERNEVHIHAPEGATPKDGPSAGITIASSLVSLALKKPAKQNVGMTGELSLRGKVMKIGGIKEKILAAKREGINELIVPKDNEENVLDLKPYVTEGMKIHYVETYEEVYKILFT